MEFKINDYYQEKNNIELTASEIAEAVQKAEEIIQIYKDEGKNNRLDDLASLIGVGNDAKSEVFSITGTKFCLKISAFSKYVGRNQERQFELNEQCMDAIDGQSVEIEGKQYRLATIPTVAVAKDDEYAYILMIELTDSIRLWDEENIPFKDKDNWGVIDEIKDIIRKYGEEKGIGAEEFLAAMDVNGNNLLVDVENRVIYLIDPYVP